ncbi:DNA topoisomerase IV subunit A [Clostridium chauvoei]|uniref:DNA topoisomerase (ATP-hydrolyzing) n=1 Tax=Clostridium chauvoei JF4335 TaxID=1351755 RepID=S6EPL6_9CLOT|nr:DNA topoisomerase IV subunit A [Clostridium chauvoei]ATD54592.1 DNA topoisomerase IV [Clostridium chauvoei]ATD57727.1 DNA topoisomerase IV [Clostridium chauvoei]MBX7281003.1 DNA topoisomerase IV subunit A [Clostridium chauvoei]MBX7283495.1 DNA topoisomerase IV subunit A [Clostridium chauvoei]MBX7286092.1 DNA topoisomerase IV subunit A [Clostridium chauvoei]
MAKKVNDIPRDNNIIRIPIEEAMPDNYLPYAIEVAKDRALPDVRDGLKPVHRRILYGAYLLKAYPDRPYYKSARIVGDILGKFHPHGDSSVYDAMVIMAQNFSTREPLIDGHGNWGSMDGDGAAAMRYTEARLAPIAMEMLRDIDKETVDMVPNYSDSELEPKVLPSRYPNLLVNGAFGIAVGLATNIPPHNLGEVTDGVLSYIDNPEVTTKDLMKYIKGPDLPTGGILIGKNSLLSAYETGEGKVTLRAKTSIEKLENGRIGIVITEFPYRRNKAKLLQTISEMTGDKRHSKALEAIIDIRDESDRNGVRAVIELKKAIDEDGADKILKYLFKKTDLQCNISFNMVALADGKPQTMGLKTIIEHYVNHQKEIVTRRTVRELQIAEKRFHIVEGFIKAIDVLDEVIKTIRESKSKKDAAMNLMNKFGFTDIQAEAILELMLYRLTGLEIKVFQKEYNELEKTIKRLKKILDDERELLKVIKTELKEITSKFENPRRTAIIEDDSEAKIDLEELIVVEDVMVTISKDGFVKRIPLKTYNRSNGKIEDIEYREGDELKFLVKSNTIENLLVFTNAGNMYQIKGINIPEGKWKEKGERLDSLIKTLNLEQETIVNVISVNSLHPNKYIQFITSKGCIKKSSLDKFSTSYTKLQALKMKDGEEVIRVDLFNEEEEKDFLKVETKNGLNFSLEIPELEDQPRNILPLQIFNLSSKDEILNVEYTNEMEFLEFSIGINSKGIIKSIGKVRKQDALKVNTDSKSDILMFTNKGSVYKISAFLLQNVNKGDIILSNIVDGMLPGESVIKISSVINFIDNKYVYFFTKKGMIKKTLLKEFEGNYSSQIAYKFKHDKDEVISVDICDKTNAEVIMVTKKAMAIKFSTENVNPMGKVASGVTGISLKEDDEVIFGRVFVNNHTNNENEIAIMSHIKLTLISKSKNKKELEIEEIKLQNRAGRGSSALMIGLDDELKEVLYN